MTTIASFLNDCIGLQCLKCSLFHEKVQGIKGNLKTNSSLQHHTVFKRIGLCDYDLRRKNLTCAHTTARNHLINLIKQLPDEQVCADTKAKWTGEIKDIEFEIIKLDISKSDSELELANLTEDLAGIKSPKEQQRYAQLQLQINQIISDFHRVVERMSVLKQRIINSVE